MGLLSGVSDDVVTGFCFYTALVLFKMMLMSAITAICRMKTKTYANPEDARLGRATSGTNFENECVERVRRCHLNDLENIYLFVLAALVYIVAAQPTFFDAMLHFRIFAASRYAHTIVYLAALPQPSRVIVFLVGIAVCLSMIFHTFIAIGHEYF